MKVQVKIPLVLRSVLIWVFVVIITILVLSFFGSLGGVELLLVLVLATAVSGWYARSRGGHADRRATSS